MAAYEYSSGGFPTSPATNDTLTMNGTSYTYDGAAWKVTGATAQEGTAILSTGETGGTKYLREDGDGTSSWQAVSGGGGIGEFISTSIAISSDDTALDVDDGTTNANIGIGSNALNRVEGGNNNIAIGELALRLNVIGNTNISLGRLSSYKTTGNGNVALGNQALYNNSSGEYNIGLGAEALAGASTSTGSYNIGIGHQTGYALSTGQYNFLGGYKAGNLLNSGTDNVMIGKNAGLEKTSSYRCVLLGVDANKWGGGGSDIIAIGDSAGRSCTGTKSIFIGANAGTSETGSSKLYIGHSSGGTSLIEGDMTAKTIDIDGTLNATGLSINGTAVGGGGAMVFVSKTTISSAVSSVSITGIDTTYDRYVIKIQAKLASSSTFNVRYSQNNGSTFDSASNYDSMGDRNGGYLYYSQNAQGYLHVDSADWYIATLDLEPSLGWINGSTGGIRSGNRTANGHSSVIISHRTLASFDALQFFAGSGNISSGIITLYGIKDS